MVHLVRSYGAGRWKTYRLVKIPAAVPSLLSGLKVSATYSISGAVVGEWIGSQKGLGYYLLRVKNSYMLDKVFACVLVIIFLSLCMNGLIPPLPACRPALPAHQKLISLFTDLLKNAVSRRVTRDFRAIYAQKHLAGYRP